MLNEYQRNEGSFGSVALTTRAVFDRSERAFSFSPKGDEGDLKHGCPRIFNGPVMDSICKQAEDRTPRMTVGLVKSAVKNETITSFQLTSPEGKSLSRLNYCEPETGQMLASPSFRRQRAKRGVSARNLGLVEACHKVALTSVCNVQADPARDTGSIPVRSTNLQALKREAVAHNHGQSGAIAEPATTFLDRQNPGPAAAIYLGRSSLSVGGTANNASCKRLAK